MITAETGTEIAAARARVAALDLGHLNPADPQGFVDDTVGYVFERLRREDPVHRSRSPVPGIDTYWSIARYQDIMQVDTSTISTRRKMGSRCRFEMIEVMGEPIRIRSSFVRGFSKLPVRIPA